MNSPLPWMGGKRRLASQILPRFPEHAVYVEPFAGAGSILLLREEPARREVLNDVNQDIVNFFRVAKHHAVEFCAQFRWAVTSRQMFEWLKITPPETLTDIQRAARFFYLQKLCYGAIPSKRHFSIGSSGRLNLVRLEEEMSELHTRLAHVVIENLDWTACIERYDGDETLFFIDPPYWKVESYGFPFPRTEYEKLAEALGSMRGRAMLTINDHPEMRRIFRDFKFWRLKADYSLGLRRKATELMYRSWK